MLPEWINYNILQWHSNSTSSLGCTWKLCRAGSHATDPIYELNTFTCTRCVGGDINMCQDYKKTA